MNIKNKTMAFGLTGSFHTFKSVILQIKELINEGANIIPIMSYNAYKTDTKFGKAEDYINEIEELSGKKIIHTIRDAEAIASNNMIDIMIIAPCSGNTLAKLSTGVVDTPVLVAAKSILKNDNPLIIGISTNDGLSTNAENIGKLLNRKNYFFVPFRQDNPITKPRSIMFDSRYINKTLEYALNKEQIQPILLQI